MDAVEVQQNATPGGTPHDNRRDDGGDEAGTGGSPVQIEIELDADATLGYASIQNAVPVIRSLRLTHTGPDALEQVQVRITCNPPFAEGAILRFERLAPGEVRRIAPVDLAPDHGFLADLQESVAANVEVHVRSSTVDDLARAWHPLVVLAYDQWAGTRALPELLAAFCMPNHPAVDRLIGEASRLLRTAHSSLSMNGYQSKSRDTVWKQVSALYSTLAAQSLQYAEPPASFGSDGQKIRTPDRILDTRVATCLDLAMLFASCLEQAGLRPVVLLKEGHAWVGVWLHAACFSSPLTDDVQAVRKRVASGELLVFEASGVAQHPSHQPSLRLAVEQGQAHLTEADTFRYAIDIHRAREAQIKPLPSRTVAAPASEPGAAEAPAAIEPTPALPPLDPECLAGIDFAGEDTGAGRLAQWKSKLLDLTLRNRLLNYKPTKTTLQLVAPDLASLEDALAEGAEFKIRPLPDLMEGADPRVADVHAQRGGRRPLDDMALEAMGQGELLARVSKEALDGNLLAIHGAARTSLEEGGANTLYLSIGLLRWTEGAAAESAHLAPILLIPVTLQRQSVRSGFRLSRHDDEAIINPTLLQLLKNSFELRIAGLEVMPLDDKGVDVVKILQAFRLAVREIPQWEVLDQAHLGIFSFTKYLMWKDLQDRTEQLKANRVVRHLIDHPGEAFPREASDELALDRLDQTHPPQAILAPLLCDSSQLKALCMVDAGRDLVLEGPPGTGKSQTITNLIAHTLAQGKTVLFVSEKSAALEVVHRRLEGIQLGPFCLELHSAKARKSEVLRQLGKALEVAGQRTAEDWAREAERLAQLRQTLNGLVDALHHTHANGLSVHAAIGTCIEHAGTAPIALPWADAATHDRAAFDTLKETVRRLATLARGPGPLDGHALAQIGHADWSPSWQDGLLAKAQSLAQALDHFKGVAQALGAQLGQPVEGWSLRALAALDGLADVLLGAPSVPLGVARQAHDAHARATLQVLLQHGQARQGHWARIGEGWTAGLAQLQAVALSAAWGQAVSRWWPKSAWLKRRVKGQLAGFRLDLKRPSDAQVHAMLAPLAEVNQEDQFLRDQQADAERLLQAVYAGAQTDWSDVAAHGQWAERFAKAVAAVSGPDAGQGEALHQALQPWVTEQRAALAVEGTVGRALLAYRDGWRGVSQALEAVSEVARPLAPLAGPEGAQGALVRLQGLLAGWQGARHLIQPWCVWRAVRDQAVAQGLQGLVDRIEGGALALSEAERQFEHSYRHWWVKKVIDTDPLLRAFSSADHDRTILEFRAADERFQRLTERYIVAVLSGRIPSSAQVVAGDDSELGRLRRELQKQRKHLPVRQLVKGLPTLLPRLKPCLLMSPLSVAQYLDPQYAQFDLVVFDEASQIPVWDAVGAIARGRQLAIVGDPKQLPPTNFFNKSADDEETAAGSDDVQDLESILDECLGAGMNRLSLQWHYRSRHESLITFSNVNYYDSRLVTFPSPVTDDAAVRFEHVPGLYDRGGSRTNRIEAQAVVQGIEAHYVDPARQHLTLGVVTFNQPQQALIETLLDARRRAHPALDRAIAERAHEPLFIKNLENVQGDERDVIFFSITFGPDAAGKTTLNFGPLNGEGGHRRLNVAISRAREAVVIYSTLLPEQIDLARVRAAGVRDLKHYLAFALKGPGALAAQSVPTGREPDSPFESVVIHRLRQRGWTVHPQVGCSGYRIDLGVVDPRAPGRYLIGIECDGRSYHSGATARDRDRLRQHVLEGLGWRIHRIWSTDWWRDPQGEMDTLGAKLDALLAVKEAVDPGLAVVESPPAGVADAALAAVIETAGEEGDRPASQGLRVYRPADLPGGDPAEFYEPGATARIQAQLRQVIDEEGPIPQGLLFRRVSRAWKLDRLGSRILACLKAAMPAGVRQTHEGEVTFYWPAGTDPLTWCDGRVADADERSRRAIDDICMEELCVLLLHVLRHAGASPRADAVRSACRLLGMVRANPDAVARVGVAVERLLARNDVVEIEGRVQIGDVGSS
jgi:very-short-patch-repair endonuclease